MERKFRTRYGRFAVARATALVFSLAVLVIVGVAFILDRNAQRANAQQSSTELAGAARVAASTFSALRANLRTHAGQLASSLPLQRAVLAHDRAALQRLARGHSARIVLDGHAYGSLPPAPRVLAGSTIGDGSRVLARITIGLRLDDQLVALLGRTTPLSNHAALVLISRGRVAAGGPTGARAVVRGTRLVLGTTPFVADAAPLGLPGARVIAVEPVAAVSARELPYRKRLLLTVLVTVAAAAGLAVRLGRPVARVLADLARLAHQAQTDALTSLANRRTLDERLDEEVDRASRLGANLSLVIADVDNFKQINDTYGHQTGDAILAAFASVLSETVREIDLPARYGGEEFALVLPGTQLAGARLLAERIRRAVAEVTVPGPAGETVSATASFGAAAYPTHSTVAALVRAADEALYEAKLSGKNRVVTATARKKAASRQVVADEPAPSAL
jgi:diguanylate cyclase (GGDEF)-like protein